MTLEYAIDGNDVLTDVDEGWSAFAHRNDAPELIGYGPGRSLWTSIASAEVAEVWRMVLADVRRTSRPIELQFRCDAPSRRRWIELTLSPEPDHHVRFRSRVVREEVRPSVDLLALSTHRDQGAPLVRACSWCCRFWDGAAWVAVEDFLRTTGIMERTNLPGLTHTICPDCSLLLDQEMHRP